MQGVLSWVSALSPGNEPATFEARLYEPLFKSHNPSDLGDAWLEDLNPESLTVIPNALAPTRLANARVGDRCAPRMHKTSNSEVVVPWTACLCW